MPSALGDTRALLADLFAAAVRAVDPAALVARHLHRHDSILRVSAAAASWSGATIVVGSGKGATRMAASTAAILGPNLRSGVIVVPHGGAVAIPNIECREAGHPLPDADGERATRRLMTVLADHPEAAVLALISGGASALAVQPRPPVTLADKVAVTAALLASGADIQEFNTVRKHLSLVKGGGLARVARGRPLVSLIISDVVGDAPAIIGSGPTAPDPTTFADALDVLQRYDLLGSVPPVVAELLRSGDRGEVPETLKPGDTECEGVTNLVIGSNRIALEAAAAAARAAGYETRVAVEPLEGDTTAAARRFAAWVIEATDGARAPLCLLAGGETTVRLGERHGKGGRNQEFALACAEEFSGRDIHLLSAGTDGVDGPTDAAGAWVDGTTVERARRRGLEPAAALAGHDSYGFFDAVGDLFRCGPTGTNVMDIKIALAGVPA